MYQNLFSTAKAFVSFSKTKPCKPRAMLHFLKTMLQSQRKTYTRKFLLKIKRRTFAQVYKI